MATAIISWFDKYRGACYLSIGFPKSQTLYMGYKEHGALALEARSDGNASVPVWKRSLDWALILLAAPFWAPVMLLIGLGIKFFSRGPILFRQERVGLNRQRFTCLKFRTMKVNADTTGHQQHLKALMQSQGPMTKLDAAGDPRLIPGGMLLRATGLDELPQLFNVLRGEMSLVGPRPCTLYEYDGYLPWHLERFQTLPGLTGLWQVSGKNKTTFDEMMHLDIDYARQNSLWLDLRILAMTLPAMITQVREARRWKKSSKVLSPEQFKSEKSNLEEYDAPAKWPCASKQA